MGHKTLWQEHLQRACTQGWLCNPHIHEVSLFLSHSVSELHACYKLPQLTGARTACPLPHGYPITNLLAPIFVGEVWSPCTHLFPLPASFFPHSLLMLNRSHTQLAWVIATGKNKHPWRWTAIFTLQTVYCSHVQSRDHFGKWPSNTEETHKQLLRLGSRIARSSRTVELLLNWSLSKSIKELRPLKNPHSETVPLTWLLKPLGTLLMSPQHHSQLFPCKSHHIKTTLQRHECVPGPIKGAHLVTLASISSSRT